MLLSHSLHYRTRPKPQRLSQHTARFWQKMFSSAGGNCCDPLRVAASVPTAKPRMVFLELGWNFDIFSDSEALVELLKSFVALKPVYEDPKPLLETPKGLVDFSTTLVDLKATPWNFKVAVANFKAAQAKSRPWTKLQILNPKNAKPFLPKLSLSMPEPHLCWSPLLSTLMISRSESLLSKHCLKARLWPWSSQFMEAMQK